MSFETAFFYIYISAVAKCVGMQEKSKMLSLRPRGEPLESLVGSRAIGHARPALTLPPLLKKVLGETLEWHHE
jgi:hypothetical protein